MPYTKMVWKNQRIDKHFWAFYYYLKKQGDTVHFEYSWDKTHADLTVYRRDDEKL